MRLISYVRVSSEGQSDNYSPRIQQQAIQQWVATNGHTLCASYSEVASGSTTEGRTAYKQALRSLGSVDGIICYRLDRLGRLARDLLILADYCIARAKSLICLDLPGLDIKTPEGKLLFTVMSGIAEQERKTIETRTMGGRRKKAAEKGYAYGAPPFGRKAKDKKLVTDKSESKTIKLIEMLRVKGYSYQAIADFLNKSSVPSKQRKDWHKETIRRILKRDYLP